MKKISLNDKEIEFINNLQPSTVADSLKKKLNKKRITVQSAKAKGRNLQQWVCSRIAGIYGIEYKQDDDNCQVHSRGMGQHGTDILITGELRTKFNYDIECKNTESFNIMNTVEQASGNTSSGREWLIVYKRNGIEPIAILDWVSFEKLLRRMYG